MSEEKQSMKELQAEFRRLPTDRLIPSVDKDYVETGLKAFVQKKAFGSPLILKGPKGSGKTLVIEQFCAENSIPMVRHNCHDNSDDKELIGTRHIEASDSGTPTVFFGCGPLTTAIDVANEYGCCILVMEEINTLPNTVQKHLNSMTDYRQRIELFNQGAIFDVDYNSKLWVVGTANPGYSGTYQFNEDLRSRFMFAPVPYPDTEQEKTILINAMGGKTTATERKFIDGLLTLSKETRGGEFKAAVGYALSTRDMVQVVQSILDGTKPEGALKELEGKYQGEQVKNFRSRVQSCFGVNLASVRLF